MTTFVRVFLIIAIVINCIVWGLVAAQGIECTDSGGTYVRGVAWFECIHN